MPDALLSELAHRLRAPRRRPKLGRLHRGGRRLARIHSTIPRYAEAAGLRIPITAERALFDEAVELGREVVWLHTFGDRFSEGRPPGPPRVDKDEPTIPSGGALPATLADMPTSWIMMLPRED